MTDPPRPEDEIEIELRSRDAVGARLVILAAVIRRAFLDERGDRDEAAEELFDLRHWLTEEGLVSQMSDDERWLIEAPLGEAAEERLAESAMAGEALAALAWAAGLVDHMPPYDAFAPLSDLIMLVPEPWEPVAPFVASLAPRSDVEIEAERERADLWLWRADLEADRTTAHGQTRAEIDAVIRDAAFEAAAGGLIDEAPVGDFLLGDRPFREASPSVQEIVAAIAERRLHALNWVCGFGTDWADVPLDV